MEETLRDQLTLLRERIETSSATKVEIANAAGVSVQTVDNLLKGITKRPQAGTIGAIEQVLDRLEKESAAGTSPEGEVITTGNDDVSVYDEAHRERLANRLREVVRRVDTEHEIDKDVSDLFAVKANLPSESLSAFILGLSLPDADIAAIEQTLPMFEGTGTEGELTSNISEVDEFKEIQAGVQESASVSDAEDLPQLKDDENTLARQIVSDTKREWLTEDPDRSTTELDSFSLKGDEDGSPTTDMVRDDGTQIVSERLNDLLSETLSVFRLLDQRVINSMTIRVEYDDSNELRFKIKMKR